MAGLADVTTLPGMKRRPAMSGFRRREKMSPLAVLAIAFIVAVGSGCGAETHPVTRPFAARNGVESGPSSGLWGDGSAGPSGMQIGCIRGRRFAVLITVHNRSKRTITLLGGAAPEPFGD